MQTFQDVPAGANTGILFNIIVSIVLNVIDYVLGIGFLSLLYGLLIFIPALAVSVRRLHDIGKSGWMYLIILIPIIGAIWLIVLFATEGNHGPNQYGSDPKNPYDEFNDIGNNPTV